jgi:hypothetical protein
MLTCIPDDPTMATQTGDKTRLGGQKSASEAPVAGVSAAARRAMSFGR